MGQPKNNLASVAASVLFLSFFLNGCAAKGLLDLIFVARGMTTNAKVLIAHVNDTKSSQENVKDQFDSSLDALIKITNAKDLDSVERYKTFKAEYEKCSAAADELKQKINDIKYWGDKLFQEWQTEIGQYQDPQLAAESLNSYKRAYSRYKNLLNKMNRSYQSLKPVLGAFNDRVLLLKHKSNSDLIDHMDKKELLMVKNKVDLLMIQMNSSIAEADEFIKSLPQK